MMKLKVYAPLITMLAFMQLLCNCAFSQVRLNTAQQIQKLIAEKQSRTPAERKISSQLLQAAREATGRPMVEGVQLKPANVNADSTGSVLMDINAIITANLLGRIKALGGKIIYSSEKFHSLRAQVNLSAVKTIAGYAEVKFIKPAAKAHLVGTGSATTKFSNAGMPNGVANGLIPFSLTPPSFKQRAERIKDQLRKYMMMPGIGSVTSEGDHTMGADSARKTYGYQGEGIRIGVLSDSYDAQGSYGETPNASTNVSTGDLPGIGNPLGNTTPVTVLKDYTGNGATDEGRAMLQIVHDIAPKAQLFFATAYSSDAEFADNILALRAAPNNCDIIIDDVIYYDEPAYQDGIIAQAVNTVTANGCMYFSSAGNGGSALKNYASIWEGDFNDKGSPVFAGDTSKIGSIHNFGTLANPEIGDTILPTLSAVYTLKWADPIGRSSNDYDLFIVTPAGDVFYSSTNIQDGTQDPYEEIDLTYYLKLYQGYQLLVFKDSTAKPVTFVINANTDGFGPAFKYTTQGLTYGHSAVANAFSVAAAPAVSAYLNLFTGTNQVEYFSSDGPRHIFFNADSTPVTPGNFMIGTNGGTIRQKPDITAADGVSTSMPGFSPFYGTSAAAPHAGAIAALLKSANPAVTPTQIRNVITSTALDIEAPGYDNNSGYGIVQAFKAMQALNPKPLPALTLGQVTVTDGAFSNHDGSIDPGESGTMVIQLLNKSLANAGFVYAKLATSTPGVTVTQDSVSFGAIAKGGSSTNTSMPFQFTVNTTVPCNSTITFYISVSPDSGRAHSQGYTYTINTGTTITSNITSAIGSAPPKSSAYTFVSGTQTGILNSTFNQSYCGYQQATPGMTDSTGQYKFNAYTFTNHETTDQCVTVTVKSLDNYYILTSAYDTLGFIPSNPRENFFASYGSYSGTMQYSFTALAGKAFTVVITNGSSFAGVAPDYTLNVTYTKCAVPLRCANLSLNASFATGATGKVYQQTLSATGGSGAYMFSLSGNLPPGLNFNGTSIIGTATQAGSFPLTVTATDPLSCNLTVSQSLWLNITGPTPNSVVAFAGTPQTVEVTGVFANTLKAKVVDINNKPLSGVDVFFTAPANTDKTIASGTFSGGLDTISIITDSLGIAESTLFTADSIAGNYTVLATVNGLPPAQFMLTNACLKSSLVTNNADNGPGSLRFIIAGACPEALVTFVPGINKITLTNGQINIVRALTITGPGADRLTVSGNSNSRIFSINPINTSDSINIYGLTISDGMPPNVNDYRGGGGILMYNGNVNLTTCVISNNDASYSSAGTGGGLEDVGGSVTINNCSIVQNTASEGGAGVNAFNCAMHIYNSTIALNNAPSIYYSYGGGIYLGNISAYIENCTIYGNTAAVGGNISSYGSAYGGNYLDTLKNTIVAGGTLIPGYTTGGPDLWGTNFVSLGYNLIQDNSSGLYSFVNGSSSTDLTGLSPNLLALGDYGGTTPTLLPKPNSPVINKGDITLPPAQFDQRGFVRVAGGRADIGAVETNYAVTAFAGTPQSAAVNTQFANALQSKVTESGNPVDSVPVVFNSASATIASGIFGNGQTTDTALTNATGTAATFITANNLTGIYKVTGSIGIPFTPANFYLTNTKALAVAFGRITATVNNCTVQIAWQTLTNEANETFTVEHSIDGVDFLPLYTATSKASGVGLQTYDYIHPTPAAGANYYRIKEADADGTFIYSETIMAVNTCSTAPIMAYPNPVHNTLTVIIPGTAKQSISIYDSRGRLVSRYSSDVGTLTIDVSKWAGGIYTLKVAKDDGSTYDLKIIKN